MELELIANKVVVSARGLGAQVQLRVLGLTVITYATARRALLFLQASIVPALALAPAGQTWPSARHARLAFCWAVPFYNLLWFRGIRQCQLSSFHVQLSDPMTCDARTAYHACAAPFQRQVGPWRSTVAGVALWQLSDIVFHSKSARWGVGVPRLLA